MVSLAVTLFTTSVCGLRTSQVSHGGEVIQSGGILSNVRTASAGDGINLSVLLSPAFGPATISAITAISFRLLFLVMIKLYRADGSNGMKSVAVSTKSNTPIPAVAVPDAATPRVLS